MTFSLRLDNRLEKKLATAAKGKGVSKSELIRRCLEEYLETETNKPTAWESGKHLFGRHGSGRTDFSENCEQILIETFRDRRAIA
jgi:hypothetical protein